MMTTGPPLKQRGGPVEIYRAVGLDAARGSMAGARPVA